MLRDIWYENLKEKRKLVGFRRKHYIEVYLKQREREVVYWTHFVKDGRHRRAVVCKIMNMRFP